MSMLPSPIPHPLDYSPWELPGWIHEALDWVVGVEWPEGDERAVWDLADQWYGIAAALAGPRTDAVAAVEEIRSGYGGIGAVAEAFDAAWRRMAEGDEAPLPVLLAVSNDLGRLVEECGCDIEGAKLEVWIELGILVVELLSLAVVTVLTAGAASPAAAPVIAATRMVVQQIFRRLAAQLARKALQEGLQEAGERAAKEAARKGVRGLARRAALGGLAEAGEEAGVSLATQAYQHSTGRRHGLDATDLGMSAVGGFAGGAVAPLAGLGRHADGRLARIGEHLGREMTGETLAEGAAGLATGQGVSLEDLARAAVSGASGSATAQADAELQRRLDGRMASLAGTSVPPPGDLSTLAPPADGAPAISVQQTAGAPTTGAGTTGGADHPAAVSVPAVDTTPVASTPASPGVATTAGPAAAPTLSSTGPAVSSVLSPVDAEPAVAPAHPALTGEAGMTSAVPPTSVEPRLASSIAAAPVQVGELSPTDSERPVGPTRPPTAVDPVVGASPAPATTTASHPSVGAVSRAADATAPAPTTARTGSPPVTGPEPPPSPPPRFPLLEVLAPGPPRRVDDPSPIVPGPFAPLPPRPRTPDEYAAWRAAEREALDRRRHRGYFEAQRDWFEDKRRREAADWLRERADHHEERASHWAAQAMHLRRTGRDLAAQRWHREAFEASKESYELREQAAAVLAGSVRPDLVTVDDDADFYRINDDVADLAVGAVETPDRSGLTGDDHPPPIDRTRRYGVRGGLRPPLALHQTDLERQMPRSLDGSVVRTADPRVGGWFRLANDGGPQADPTRGINCVDCTLSLYETWVHGRPRVSAPRTFDGYLEGDVSRPIAGESDGPRRIEESTGGRFQRLCEPTGPANPGGLRQAVERGYRDLQEQVLAGGHGSYAFLISSWEGGGAHAWVALNQNGTVLYLDPQTGHVRDRPLYTHSGWPARENVIGIDALVLGRDGRPMPLAGRPPGDFTVLPGPPRPPEPPTPRPLPTPPDPADDSPDFNHVHLLGESTTVHPPGAAPAFGSGPESDPDGLRRAHLGAHADRIAAGLFVRDAIVAGGSLDAVFAAGVTPVELADHLDVPVLRQLAPELDEAAARDVVRLLADPRVRHMLDQTWEAPPRGEPLLAETLVRQLTQRPDLVRMILATPELASSLTTRPMTLHHLASHQQAIDVLGEVLDDIAERGPAAVAAQLVPDASPTPLTRQQRQVSARLKVGQRRARQPGFDVTRRSDPAYRRRYLDQLFIDAVAAQAEINELGRRLAESSDGGAVFEGRSKPKDRQRAEDKVVKYRGDVSRLKDLAAGRVSFQRLADLYAALEALPHVDGIEIVEYEDRFVVPQLSGYRDIQLRLRTSTGHVAEFRLELAPLNEVATWEHALYEVKRDLETIAAEQDRRLSPMEAAIRNGILHQERHYFWRALQSALSGSSET